MRDKEDRYVLIELSPKKGIILHKYDTKNILDREVRKLLHKDCNQYKTLHPGHLFKNCNEARLFEWNTKQRLTMLFDAEAFFHSNDVNRLASFLDESYRDGKAILGTVLIAAMEEDEVSFEWDVVGIEYNKDCKKIIETLKEMSKVAMR